MANKVGDGDIDVVIDGERLVLRPNYNASVVISRTYGGIRGAITRIVNLDMDAIVTVLQLGLGYGAGRPPPKDFGEKVFRTGLTDEQGSLAEQCVLYCRTLANGGKRPDDNAQAVGADTEDPSTKGSSTSS